MKKTTSISITGLLVIITFLLIPSTGNSIYYGKGAIKQPQSEFAPGRLIVKLKPEVDKKIILDQDQGIVTTGLPEFDQLNLRFSVKKQEKLFKQFKETALKSDKFSSVYILEVPEETDLEKMKKEYQQRPEVEYVELDYKVELFGEPDDSLFENQWYLNNTGQGYLGVNRIEGDSNDTQIIKYGTEDADIDATEAFQRDDETTIPLVGIIDTGLDLDHEDLSDNIWTNPGEVPDNGLDDDNNGFVDDFYGWDFSGDDIFVVIEESDPTDYYGHGTHCAGIAGGVRDNQIGISGITSPCKIMAIKVFPIAFFSVCAKGIIYAADMGCDVINMSWGSPYHSALIEDALDYAVSKGVLPIAAAGNSGCSQSFYPAALPQVFTVGASNSDDQVTNFSTYGNHIEVVAPGEDILSLRADSTDMYAEGGASGVEPDVHIVDGKYYLADGTSMASPCAVGVAAHILAASPGITTERLIEIMEQSADDIIDPYGTGDNLPGKDIYSGYGRVNLNSALQLLSGRLAKIDYPCHDALVSGDVAILGTASGDSFQSYTLDYGQGYSPQDWIEIESSDTPVSKDTLGIWNTPGLTGRYTLRLTVGEQNQAVVHVVVNNEMFVQITSPVEGDTIELSTEVHGYAIVPDFSHYTLEYGQGESPSHWYTITSSGKAGADDSLGSWLVSVLKESDYTLRLTAQTNTAETYSDSIRVFVKGYPFGGWSQYLPSYGSISPAVGDIDGDGFDEVVLGIGSPELYGTPGGVYVFSHQGQLEAGWPKDTDKNMFSSPALGDLDNDGTDDIVICSEQGIHAYLSTYPDWTREANTSSGSASEKFPFATPIIADLENDGYLEVLTVNEEGTVYAWRNDGEPVVPGYGGVFVQTTPVFEIGFPSLAVADLDRDGQNEIVVAIGGLDVSNGIFIYDIEGNMLLGPEDYPNRFNSINGIAIADLDKCDDLEIIVIGSNTDYYVTLSAFKKDGTQVEGYPIVLEGLYSTLFMGSQPAVGDLDGDGTLEIVVTLWAGGVLIYAWHQDGTPVDPEGNPKLTNVLFTTCGSPVLADINGDNNVEIIFKGGFSFTFEPYFYEEAKPEGIYAFDYYGNPVPGFPLYVSSEAFEFTTTPYTPVIGDMDIDGKLDMVLCTDRPNFQLIFWELDADYDSTRTPWPKYMHDKWNSKVFGEPLDTTARIAWEPEDFTDPYVHVPLNQVDTLYLTIEKLGTKTLSITEISSGAGWISINPTSGTIPPGGCALDIELIVSGGNEETFLADSIRIVSNDEVGNDDIYVRMHVVVSNVYEELEFAVVGNPNYYLSESNVGNLGQQNDTAGFFLHDDPAEPNFLTDGSPVLAFTSPDNDSLVARYIFDEHYLMPETELVVDSFPYLKTIVAEAKFSPVTPQAPLPWHHQWWYWTIEMKDYLFYSGSEDNDKEQYLALRILYLYYNPPPDWWPLQEPLPNIPETYLGMALDIDCPSNWDAWNYPFIDSTRRMAYLQGYGGAMEHFRMAVAQRDPCYELILDPLDTITCCWPDPVILAQPDKPYALHILRNDAFILPQHGYDDDSLYKYLSTPGYSIYGSGNEADYNIVTAGKVIPAQSFSPADTYSVAYALTVSDRYDVAHLDTLVDMILCGNANRDNTVSVADVVSVINYLFKSGSESWLFMSDCNADGQVTITDAVYLINYLFKGGARPRCSSIH